MRIVFFGTPDFAAICLKKILSSNHKVVCVVTCEDKQRGRGQKVTITPVKEIALQNNIDILQPNNLKDDEFVNTLIQFNADVFVVVAFRILPEKVFSIPKKGTFNLHGSLLPKYRGAAPIQWALINGEKTTGLTTFFIQRRVDTGNIILQNEIPIHDEDNFESLHDRMALVGGDLIVETLTAIDSGIVNLQVQNESLVSPAPKINSNICAIDFRMSSIKIHNLVRGLSPYPCAYFFAGGKKYKVFKTRIPQNPLDESNLLKSEINFPYKIEIYNSKKNIYIKCLDGFIEILEIQPEGKRSMSAEEFLRGNKFQG